MADRPGTVSPVMYRLDSSPAFSIHPKTVLGLGMELSDRVLPW
jgi:hypothetical protein